jgi:putative transposase
VVHTCIVHLIRNSRAFVPGRIAKAILPTIKAIGQAEKTDMGLVLLEDFEDGWCKRYPAIGQAWRRAWAQVAPFFVRSWRPQDELQHQRRRGRWTVVAQDHQDPSSFPHEEAALKLLYLAKERRIAGRRWRRVDGRYGSVHHSVRLAFSGIVAMITVSIKRPIRRTEFGQ